MPAFVNRYNFIYGYKRDMSPAETVPLNWLIAAPCSGTYPSFFALFRLFSKNSTTAFGKMGNDAIYWRAKQKYLKKEELSNTNPLKFVTTSQKTPTVRVGGKTKNHARKRWFPEIEVFCLFWGY